jgi:type IV pilus assembly protein PilC
MANFTYQARDKSGAITSGTLFAVDRSAAAANLLEKGMVPILIKDAALEAAKKSGLSSLLSKGGGKVKTEDKVIFSRQFATMINAGVPINQSLGILRDQSQSKHLQEVIGQVAKAVEGGSTLANALAAHPEVFGPIYINMVRAGETGGILDQVLDRLATQQEKDAEIVGKVKSASIYPGVVFSFTMIVFIFLMTVIVPKLSAIFQQMGANLPVYTKIMLAISHALVHDGIIIAIVAGAGVYAFRRYIKTPKGKHQLDLALIKAPAIGPIIVKVNIARFARTFGSLMSSGISVLDAIKATSESLGNSVFSNELTKMASEVKNGKPVSEQLKHSKYFPPIVAQMISVGEETGQLDSILLKLAEFYEKEVDQVISGLTSIIEPMLIIILGAMVGMVVISVFGPIASLSSSVNG